MKQVPFWTDTAKEPAAYSPAELPSSVDLVVVGAGLAGLSAALHAAELGASVLLLEKGTVGIGASGRNGGMATTGLAISFRKAVARYGEERAVGMFRAYNDAIDTIETLVTKHGIDCGFSRTGKLNLASKPSHYEGFRITADLLHRLVGQEVTMVPAADIRSEVGSDHFHGGMVDPLGAAVQVGDLVYGLARAASQEGAVIAENCGVLSLTRAGAKHDVHTVRGTIRADEVILASGVTTHGVMPWISRRIVPIGSFIIATEPLDPAVAAEILPHRRVASDSKHLIYYFRLSDDNRLVFGGRARFAMSNPTSDLRSGEILRAAMTEVFPQLAGVGVEYCWGGEVDMSLDQMVHTGVHDGVHYAVGYSGHGVQMATHMGKILANRVVGTREGGGALDPWGALPFRAVPGHFGRPWFLPPVGAYYRFLDTVS